MRVLREVWIILLTTLVAPLIVVLVLFVLAACSDRSSRLAPPEDQWRAAPRR